MELVNHLGKKLLSPRLPDVILDKLDIQDTQKNNWWTCLKVRWFFRVSASWKSLPDILQDIEENDWQTANTGRIVFEISCFVVKSAGYYEPVG